MDTSRAGRVGEFRGLAGPYWSLRPVGGGSEWEVDPKRVRPVVHDGLTAPEPCRGCQEIDHAEAVAGAERDATKQAACRASRRRHETAEHGAPS